VHVIDVGQGDSLLYEQNGHYALIDAGTADSRPAILAYLQEQNVEKLDYLIMTHSHADHIGAMKKVLETVKVDKVILPDFTKGDLPTTSMFNKVLETIDALGVPAVTAADGQIYPLGNGQFAVIKAGVQYGNNMNNMSIVTRFTAPQFSFMASGDAEKEVEAAILEDGTDISAMVYKAGHHGSTTSNTPAFVKAINPSAVVVSCGLDNDYGHPHKEIVELFHTQNIEMYRTDLQGHLVVTATENGPVISTQK
ncbi:MAG: ComEC/Rec2 family competence protein, partial [Oscillospiraceae bacterium]|nr:ComEC/Rec2 family competence protein [Oscillospiraceae bacterium]